MQDLIKKVLASLPRDRRQRWAFVAQRSKNYTKLQPSRSAVQQAEAVIDEVAESLCELVGLSETPIKSKKMRRGVR